ncbi:lipid-A-disaccharide synthase N-terminal domain-containing protein [Chelatococcus sp. GCM10030263]|uniref:lipid-A-disaccharide synthase N-terminal domain-containing protein n=1 Tax=Chelatococcus sp. GCM10030263 TaxID=3273387 RepID=UPI003618D651
MLIALSQNVGGYLYEVFIEKFDLWLLLGLFGQTLFGARFLVQWLVSERQGRSVIPLAFWFFSIGGGLITLAYGLHRREPVIIFGQALSIFIYVRNLMLIARDRRQAQTAKLSS